MNAEEILNLFELVKNAPEENWEYNKSRLREILYDYEKRAGEALVINGVLTNASTVTAIVLETLQIIKNSNTLDDILVYPQVRERFRKRLYVQMNENYRKEGFITRNSMINE